MADQTEFNYDVFISYSHADKAWVRGELLKRLEASGLRACIDTRDFRPGAPIVKEMERAVLTSRRTLIVLTPSYLKSAWTEFETLLLQTLDPANQNLRLLPLLKEKCDVSLRIRYLGYVDFVDEPETAWERLLSALSAPQVPPAEPPQPSTGPTLDTSALDTLRQQLIERCSLSDLKELCFALDVAHENYPPALNDFARELLLDLNRRGRVDEFVQLVRQAKPWVLR